MKIRGNTIKNFIISLLMKLSTSFRALKRRRNVMLALEGFDSLSLDSRSMYMSRPEVYDVDKLSKFLIKNFEDHLESKTKKRHRATIVWILLTVPVCNENFYLKLI
jgi:hypothetical protein